MPLATQQLTTIADMVRVTAILPVERLDLVAVGAMMFDTSSETPDVFGEIGLALGNADRPNRLIVLAAGLIKNSSSLSWTGLIPLAPDMVVYLAAWSKDITNVKFSAITRAP